MAASPPPPGRRLVVAGLATAGGGVTMLFAGLVALMAVGSATGAAAVALAVVLLLGVAAIAVGGVLSVVGLVQRTVSAPQMRQADRARAQQLRDQVVTPAQALAVQERPVTGRSWRRWLPVLVVLAPFALVAALGHTRYGALGAVVAFCALAAVVGWLLVRQRVSSKELNAYASAYGAAHPDAEARVAAQSAWEAAQVPQDAATAGALATMWRFQGLALLGRQDAVAAAAAQLGWQFTPVASPVQPAAGQVGLGGLKIARNVCTGTLPVGAFTAADLVGISGETQVNGRTTDIVLDAASTVRVWFPTPFRLAVTAHGLDGQLRLSSYGPPVALESAEFDAAFVVYSADAFRTRLVLNPAVMADLLGWRGIELVVDGGTLTLSQPHHFVPADRLSDFVALAGKIAASARAARVT